MDVDIITNYNFLKFILYLKLRNDIKMLKRDPTDMFGTQNRDL